MTISQRARRARQTAGADRAPGIAAAAAANAPSAVREIRGIPPVVNRHAALSWGDNSFGQLGRESAGDDSSLPGEIDVLGAGVVQVSAGGGFGLALTSDGTVWAWGDNSSGQLGSGDAADRGVPRQVTGLRGVTQVSAGGNHSLALRSDGTVWAWGDNENGEVGDGSLSIGQLLPIQVTGLAGVTKIAAGNGFSLALRSDGTVWAWGSNYEFQLGNGTQADSSVPVQVSGLTQVSSITAGVRHSLATRTHSITALTSLWAWGVGAFTHGIHPTPELVTGITAPSIAGIAAGASYSEALGSDGSVWGWGAADSGQLGFTPGINPVTSPVETIGAGSQITQLSATDQHTLALQSNGAVLAWGSNGSGELGNGVTSDNPTPPVKVSGLTGATQVSAGWGFSLAVYLPRPQSQ